MLNIFVKTFKDKPKCGFKIISSYVLAKPAMLPA